MERPELSESEWNTLAEWIGAPPPLLTSDEERYFVIRLCRYGFLGGSDKMGFHVTEVGRAALGNWRRTNEKGCVGPKR